jgi:hypothetical protein
VTTPPLSGFPASQRAIQARCVHPSGRSADFPRAALESMPGDRFARQAALHADRPAVETREHVPTYRGTHRRAAGVAARLRGALDGGSEPGLGRGIERHRGRLRPDDAPVPGATPA